jgi:hypothetical protein
MSPDDRPTLRGEDEIALDRTMLSAGNVRDALRNSPRPAVEVGHPPAPLAVPQAPIGFGGTNFTPSRSEQLVVPVSSRTNASLPGALGPSSFPPVVATPQSGSSLRLVGIVLVAVAVIAVVLAIILRGNATVLVEMPIITTPPGAKVMINGEEQADVTPIVAILPAGKTHSIELRVRGYRPFKKEVSPMAGVAARIEEKLDPVTGIITLDLDPPDSVVFVNGVNKGASLKSVDGLLVGQDLVVRIEHPGYLTKQETVSLTEQAPNATVHAKLEKAPK